MREWLMDVTVEGLNLERLIRKAGEADISLENARRAPRSLKAQVLESRLPELTALCDKGGWRLTKGGRHGAGKLLSTLNKRRLLLASGVAGTAVLLVSAMLMWTVEISGAGSYQADMLRFLTENGYTRIQWKNAVNMGQLRDELEWRYPKVAWIEVGFRGPALHVSVHEGQSMGEALTYEGCCDVVASRSGVVESVVTVAGTPMVKTGDLVKAGDVLIKGEERGENETVHPVAARGTVMARVWDGATIRVSMTDTETIYTGRTEKKTMVRTPWFPLWQTSESDFATQDISMTEIPLGGLFFPFVLQHQVCYEAKLSPKTRDLEEAKAEAALGAMRKLREKVGTKDKFIDKWVEYSMIEDEEMQAVAIGERLMDIGQRRDYEAPQPGTAVPESSEGSEKGRTG